MSKHKQYSAELKTQVVLEVLKNQKSLAQICREYEVVADLVCHWREVFLDPRANRKTQEEEQHIAELERMVGRLTMELDASKKVSRLLPSRASNDVRS